MSFISEFKKFALRGSVIDMAVGIIIGAAFMPIVNSLVNDILMPPIGMLIGGMDFSQLALTLRPANPAEGVSAVMINYGKFINVVISFLIVAFTIFMIIKFMNKLTHKSMEEPALTADQKLLTEIRDLLKK